jgi:3,4-dihydroxy 2-butanone 4-phosphate synthase/GTP cyclohydrolase II
LDEVAFAIDQIRAGRPVVVIDDAARENEGDLILAAELATPELVAFMIRHTSGFICVSITDSDADRLDLPPMYHTNEDRRGTAYTVSVDAREGVGTGISATDRAHTMQLLAARTTRASDLTRPGHVVPLRAMSGGVLSRAGHTEAALDLVLLAQLQPAGVLSEIVSAKHPLEMARCSELREFCDEHGLAMISIAGLAAYRRQRESIVSRRVQARLPLPQGTFAAIGYHTTADTREHLALVCGDISSGEDLLVSVHTECLVGDLFRSLDCDCRVELDEALTAVASEQRGVVLYLRGDERRGAGMLTNVAARHPRVQSQANVTFTAASAPADAAISARILADLGIKSLRLRTSTESLRAGLADFGIRVLDDTAVPPSPDPDNLRYLVRRFDRGDHVHSFARRDPEPPALASEAPGG